MYIYTPDSSANSEGPDKEPFDLILCCLQEPGTSVG